MADETLAEIRSNLTVIHEKLTLMVGHMQGAFQAANEAAEGIEATIKLIDANVCKHENHTGYYRSDTPGKYAFFCKDCQTEVLVDESEVE